MKKVLVTGADGFIGSHLVETLVEAGLDVRAFVFYNSFASAGWLDHSNARHQVELFAGDIRDAKRVRDAMAGCDTVFHLAALIAIPFSYSSVESYVDTNVRGTMNVLQAALECGAHVLQTSTSEVYGTAQFVPITEDHPLRPQSPYAATKVASDQLALSYHRSFDLPVTVVRPFNTYGPRQSTRAVIPTIITQIASGKESIRLGALAPTRDFNYATDTASGFLALAKTRSALGEVVNLGSGFEVSIGETAELIAQVAGKAVRIEADPQRMRPATSEVERLFADFSKATRLSEWTPEFGGRAGFVRGLEKTYEWFSNPANRAAYRSDGYTV